MAAGVALHAGARNVLGTSDKVNVTISGRTVAVQAWQYDAIGIKGYSVPVLFLDNGIPGNSDYDSHLSDYLYGGDNEYRLSQEVVLGIGGVKMLRELGFDSIARFHMNEGHAALLVLELYVEIRNAHQESKRLIGIEEVGGDL